MMNTIAAAIQALVAKVGRNTSTASGVQTQRKILSAIFKKAAPFPLTVPIIAMIK